MSKLTPEAELSELRTVALALTTERDDLRATVEKLTVGAADELTAAQAAVVAKDARIGELTAEVSALAEKVAALELTHVSAAKQAAEIVRLQESLSAWKKGHAEVVDAAKELDAQRAEHAARAILAERKLADANRKNLDLYNIGNEILAKYEGFGLGTAITAREPFTKSMRVKLENYVQDFGDKLEDGKIQPGDAPKAAATKEQAAAVQKPVQQ